MEVKIKIETTDRRDLEEFIEAMKEIEKEHSVNCTLEVNWY